jgi:hypothetical protein
MALPQQLAVGRCAAETCSTDGVPATDPAWPPPRARTRSRSASALASGTHTDVRSPPRRQRASFTASRRSVFTRSPAFTGTSVGATTAHPTPNSVSCQYSTYPVGPHYRLLPLPCAPSRAHGFPKIPENAVTGQKLSQRFTAIGSRNATLPYPRRGDVKKKSPLVPPRRNGCRRLHPSRSQRSELISSCRYNSPGKGSLQRHAWRRGLVAQMLVWAHLLNIRYCANHPTIARRCGTPMGRD